MAGSADAADRRASAGSGLALDDSSFIGTLDPALARPILTGFANSLDLVFLIGACVLALALVVVIFLPEEPLRTQSGLQAREAQDVADAESAMERAEENVIAVGAAESGATISTSLPSARGGQDSEAPSPC